MTKRDRAPSDGSEIPVGPSANWLVALERTHGSVRAFARVEIEALVRKVIHRLQRIPSSGIYGGDYIYKTLWDDYCHERQEGPHDLLETPWRLTIDPFLEQIAEQVPSHAAVLLSIYAAWEFDELAAESVGSVWPEGIKRLVQDGLQRKAGMRSLDHLGPWRNG